jgi:hypothetical protein
MVFAKVRAGNRPCNEEQNMARLRKELSKAADGRLKTYSLAAMAAGVGALALVHPAEAQVVVTQTNLQLNSGGSVPIDLNNDGVTDFILAIEHNGYDHGFYGSFGAMPVTGGKVMAGTRGTLGAYASALGIGAVIGPSAHFSSSAGRGVTMVERSVGFVSASTANTVYGNWGNASYKHLGVKFLISGETHYGWIQMSTDTVAGMTATIEAYAYEVQANKKVTIGTTADKAEVRTEPETKTVTIDRGPALGMLALGADGLEMWRR